MKPKISSYPIEVFGTIYSSQKDTDIKIRNAQYCPFIKRECTKPRKSEPHIKVGICTVGYKGFLDDMYPNIICPHRFLEKDLFDEIKNHFYPNWTTYQIASEVNMSAGGNVDYVMFNSENNDFLCVEIQANGTTGSPYPYVLELLSTGKYSGKKYTFGLNWANEFSKTMMQQAYKKGKIVTSWKKNIVFVIQDVAMLYLQKNMDTSSLRNNLEDNIHFLTVKMVWSPKSEKFILQKDKWFSGDIAAISKILGGVAEEEYPDINDFIEIISRRLESFNFFD